MVRFFYCKGFFYNYVKITKIVIEKLCQGNCDIDYTLEKRFFSLHFLSKVNNFEPALLPDISAVM